MTAYLLGTALILAMFAAQGAAMGVPPSPSNPTEAPGSGRAGCGWPEVQSMRRSVSWLAMTRPAPRTLSFRREVYGPNRGDPEAHQAPNWPG